MLHPVLSLFVIFFLYLAQTEFRIFGNISTNQLLSGVVEQWLYLALHS